MSKCTDSPNLPTRTGVPYIDREVLQDVDLGLASFKAGDVHRVRLDRFEQADNDRDRRQFFGAGQHLCLGRFKISTDRTLNIICLAHVLHNCDKS